MKINSGVRLPTTILPMDAYRLVENFYPHRSSSTNDPLDQLPRVPIGEFEDGIRAILYRYIGSGTTMTWRRITSL